MPYRAQTALEAANLALSTIGEPPIGSFQDSSSRARVIRVWYGTVRDRTQRQHDWGFGSAWFVPPMSPIASLGHLKNRFIMPEDCLKVRDVRPYRPNVANQTGISITDPNIIAELESLTTKPIGSREWTMEAASVGPLDTAPSAMVFVTNMQAPIANYSRRVDNVRLWSPDYVEAFVKDLAGAIAPEIAKDINAGEKKAAEAEAIIDDAARTDSREQSPRHVSRTTSWVRSRFIGGGWRTGRPPF